MSSPDPLGSVSGSPGSPFDVASLARLATDFFRALPGDIATPASPLSGLSGSAPGLQGPTNFAPAGSPLASPAGFGPSVPGTPIPQGQWPGTNLIPASPTGLSPLANRIPALAPHALAGNGVPDQVLSIAPAMEPRFGSAATGVPRAPGGASPRQAIADPSFYFLALGGAPVSGGGPKQTSGADTPVDDGFVPFEFDRSLASLHAGRSAPAIGRPEAIPTTAATNGLAIPAQAGNAPTFYYLDSLRATEVSQTPRADHAPREATKGRQVFDVHAIRRDFPILSETVNGRPLAWFDNAATTQKPQAVIDRLAYFYAHENSNIHRAAHELAGRATDAYEKARESARRFINAPDVDEVIFVRGTTEGINLVAKSWGAQHVGPGDEIIVSHLEHHANIVPWQQLAAAKGAKLRVIPVDDWGQVLLDEYQKLLSDRTKIVSVTQVSNALGTVVPVKQIIESAHRAGARTLVDGAQSVSHMRVDVQALDADFFVFSGHKVFGPTGIGVVWGKRALLEDMPPWQGGGNMISDVTFEKTTYQAIPNKFEAGTGNIADAAGLGAAIEYVERIGIERIGAYEHELLAYGMQLLGAIPGVRLIGTADDKASVMSFVLKGHSTEDVGQALNREGIAVRTGHHCAQPILRRFGVEATVRPSLAFYNTFEEIDRLIGVVRRLAGQRRTV